MNLNRLLQTDTGKYLVSVVLGIGISCLFRKVCEGRNCIVFKGPNFNDINGKTIKYDNKCYKLKENVVKCNKNKKIVEFA